MAEASRCRTVVKKQGRIGDAKRRAGEFLCQERIVKGARVIEIEEAKPRFVDQGWPKDMLIGDRQRAVLISAAQGERRSQAGRIRKRIKRGKVAEEESAAQRVVLTQPAIEPGRKLVLLKLRGLHVELLHQRIVFSQRAADDAGSEAKLKRARAGPIHCR